jgi:autotransporter-associated beta strand protein
MYTWDQSTTVDWATSSGGTPTETWQAAAVNSAFPRFTLGGADTITLTVNGSNLTPMAGLYQEESGTLNIAATAGSSLPIASGIQGFLLTGPVNITCPLTGTGGIEPEYEASGAALYLYGTNTYSGGTYLYSSSALVYINNSNSFGTGTIMLGSGSLTGFNPVLATAPVTIPNNWVHYSTDTADAINFASGPSCPVTCSGTWTLGAYPVAIRNNGDTTAPLTLSGVISGTSAATVNLSASNGGKITFSGANTYAGQTIIAGGANVAGVGLTLSVSSINSVTTPAQQASSSLGVPASAAAGTISIGNSTFTSTLIYTGAGETSDRIINLAGTTGGATIEMDGTGPLVLTAVNTATGVGAKTLTLQGSSTAANSIGKIVDSSSGATAVVKAGTGTWGLSAANTYSGGTTVNAGTLDIPSGGSIAGNVTVNSSGTLELDSNSALSSIAGVTIASGGTAYLNFSGAQSINALTIGGTSEPTGTWGSPTSSATHKSSVFTGNGVFNVGGLPIITSQPQSATVWPDTSVTFTVGATGATSYQWALNGSPVGANSSSYTVVAEAGNAGTYTCGVTNANGGIKSANAVLTVLGTNAYTQIVRGDSPISYWRLDESSGTTAYDSVGSNNGTYNNVVLNQTPGYSTIDPDACIYLPTTPSYVSVANYQAFNFFTNSSPTFTLEGWAYVTNNIAGTMRLFSTDQNVQPLGYMFGISGGNQLLFTCSGYNDYFSSTFSPLQLNVWYYLVVGCDGSTLHFYVNGQSVGTQVLAAAPRGGTNGVPMCLGANGNFPATYQQIQGKIDECAIYGTFLGDSEVLNHYNASLPNAPSALTPTADFPTNYVSLTTTLTENATGQNLSYQWYMNGSPVGANSSTLTIGPLQASDATSYTCYVSNSGGHTNPPPVVLTVLPIPTSAVQVGLSNGLVLHLPFDGNYNDISGYNNNGTAVGAPTLQTGSAAIGNGYLTYESDSSPSYNYVTLGNPSSLQVGSSVDFSVAFWVRQPYANISTNLPFFADTVGSIGATLGMCFAPGLTSLAAPNGGWAWELYDGTHQDYATGTGGSISDGNWHHLAFVFQRTGNATTYLDGQQVDVRDVSYLANSLNTTNAFNIGQDGTGAFAVPPSTATSADMDDLGFWRRALTPLQVSGMYLAGVSNTPGVSFAPAITLAPAPTPTTISNISGTTLSYGGGSGSQFVLLGTNNVAAPLTNWTRIHTNTSTPGSFTIPAVGSASATFYRVQSQ